MNSILLIAATLFAGLMAGLFYAWSISVTPGLANVNNENYLHAFQSMNRAILNPIFLIVFFGLVILLPLLSYLTYGSTASTPFWYIVSAAALYLTGVMAVTILGNIPLNNSLEILKINSMSSEQMSTFRQSFENKWNTLNMVRTICSSISFILLIIACLQNELNK